MRNRGTKGECGGTPRVGKVGDPKPTGRGRGWGRKLGLRDGRGRRRDV